MNSNNHTHTAGQTVNSLILHISHYPSIWLHPFFSNPSFHILLTPWCILRLPLLLHLSSLISYPSFHPIQPLLFSAHPSTQISLNIKHYSSFFLSQSVMASSPPLCLYFFHSPLCLLFCPHSPFTLSAVNGGIMSLLSVTWWGGVNTAA